MAKAVWVMVIVYRLSLSYLLPMCLSFTASEVIDHFSGQAKETADQFQHSQSKPIPASLSPNLICKRLLSSYTACADAGTCQNQERLQIWPNWFKVAFAHWGFVPEYQWLRDTNKNIVVEGSKGKLSP